MASKPIIILLSLAGDQQIFNDIYGRLLRTLDDKADVKAAHSTQQALELLTNSSSSSSSTTTTTTNNSNTPQGIFVTDSGLTLGKNDAVAGKVVEYARNGGRVVIGGLFSSYTRPSDIGAFFRTRWGLPWESGTYQRTRVRLNNGAAGVGAADGPPPRFGLPHSYSQKAVFLRNVCDSAALYVPSEDAWVDESQPTPTFAEYQPETPVAFARVGEGWLGYVGDVNAEEETDNVVLGMLGLLRESSAGEREGAAGKRKGSDEMDGPGITWFELRDQ